MIFSLILHQLFYRLILKILIMAEMTTTEMREMIDAQREEITALRKERDELKVKLNGGDVDEEVKNYLEDKYKRESEAREKQQNLKNNMV